MEASNVQEHDHSLKLIDLQLEYPHYEEDTESDDEDEEEDGDRISKEGFHGACVMCGKEIHMYHKYYYGCTIGTSCDFSFHKFCGELSTRLEHTLHPHPLFLQRMDDCYWPCRICKIDHKPLEMHYRCSECSFFIDVNCAVQVGKNTIHHPCHPHLLMCANPKPILCHCSACGKRHEGIFYQCTICVGFTIDNDCAFLPKTLLIQQATNNVFYHTHPLTISYSFPYKDQEAKHFPRCRVCGGSFYFIEQDLWIYKCEKCLYYAHVHCAASTRESSAGTLQTIKDYKDADYPGLLHLPFPDETYSIPKHMFFQETRSGLFITDDEVSLQHISHEHPLILVDKQSNGQSSSKINLSLFMCHNPMEKTQLLCNGCLRPIMATMPFYRCTQGCNYVLHEWCTRLPTEIEIHPGHPDHTLRLLYSNALPVFFGVFSCAVCSLRCNGFAYGCVQCEYYVDVCCGFIPTEITHKSHPDHLLSIVRKDVPNTDCTFCNQLFFKDQLLFHCNTCAFLIHPECALLLPEAVRHSHDKHSMHLSYLPIENHKSEYFCEICEEDLNPHNPFYHCQECAQSVHTACAPLILQCETDTYIRYRQSTYLFLNIKFGGIHNTHSHPHPLSFAQGTVLDGGCSMCGEELRYQMMFKCIGCNFAIDYDCCDPSRSVVRNSLSPRRVVIYML